MKTSCIPAALLFAVASSATLLSSCALFRAPEIPHGAVTAQLAQLDFGPQAHFARCLPPACPARTPKTLAVKMVPQPIPAPLINAEPPPSVPAPASRPETRLTVTVNFTFNSARLSRTEQSVLNSVATDISQASSITITGHTDATGPQGTNDTLALSRAQAVADYLRQGNPDLSTRMTVEGHGVCCFIAKNDTPAGRARNRRAEIVIRIAPGSTP
ncbi:MAG: OmpA family protein [Rhodocyclaceae bacterium]|nr:MAG: OmpA family protein [Rhodocyclaceae bacterium]